jgi:hypothetical protein
MKTLIIVALLFTGGAVQGQTVAEYVKFQQAKTTTYAQAVYQHKQTKKMVIVWVGCEDFKAWKDLGDEYIHCFCDRFQFTERGVVVAGDYNGVFSKMKVVDVENVVPKIRECRCEKCDCNPCDCYKTQGKPQPQAFSFQPYQILPANCYGGT